MENKKRKHKLGLRGTATVVTFYSSLEIFFCVNVGFAGCKILRRLQRALEGPRATVPVLRGCRRHLSGLQVFLPPERQESGLPFDAYELMRSCPCARQGNFEPKPNLSLLFQALL